MSQSGLIDIEGSHPQIPTQFDADSGSAVPIANVLEVQGLTVANATYAKPIFTTASGNTLVINGQVGKSVTGAPGDKLDAGLVSFDDTEFTVDADGYVTLIGGSLAVDTNTGDDSVTVSPDALGNFNWNGITVANSTHAKPAYFKDATAANTIDLDIQVGAAVTGAPGDKNDAGLSSYNNVFNTVDADGYVDLTTNWEATSMHGWNGSVIETVDGDVSSDGATITYSVEKSGGGDLTVVFSDGYYSWDTTPADTIALTPGTDTVPVLNYVYFLQSTKTLTASTVGWPATEHAPLATVLCQTAASLQTQLAMKDHAWTDHVIKTNNQGHISDINFWIRQQPATWVSGVVQTYTITTNGGAADNVILTTTAGVVLQLHDHTMPAFSGTPTVYVVNDNATPYTTVTDLNALLTDSAGVSMSGKYFSLVIWGCVSEDTGECKLFCNLPGGSYNNAAGVTADSNKYADFSIPQDFVGTGFLISQWNLRHQAAASGTWNSIDEIDLRGLLPSITPGGSTAFPNEFIDSVFRILDDVDNTKEIAFQAASITAATTRTVTMLDADIDLANVTQAAIALTDNLVVRGDGGDRGVQTSTLSITDNGEMTNASQPAFQARHTVSQDNATGNNTAVTVNFTTEVFDQNSDYDGTNTFVAPVTGRYRLTFSIFIANVSGGTAGNIKIITTNRTYQSQSGDYSSMANASNSIVLSMSVLCDMTAMDNATCQTTVNGIGADTADLTGAGDVSWFMGELVC